MINYSTNHKKSITNTSHYNNDSELNNSEYNHSVKKQNMKYLDYHPSGSFRYLFIFVLLMSILLHLPGQMVNASNSLRIYQYANKKSITYTDKQVKVTLNGEQISRNNTPGILDQGVALVPYYEIFRKSDIKASTLYNKSKGTITISRASTKIVLTIDSKKAILNGKTVNLSVAPRKLKLHGTSETQIYVPSRFVAEALGIQYTWNSRTSTVAMVDQNFIISHGSVRKYNYSGIKGKVTFDGKNIGLGNMPSIFIDSTPMSRAKKVFGDVLGAKYSYNKSNKKVTLIKNDNTLVMTLGSKTAYLNGMKLSLPVAPISVKNHNVNTSYIMVPTSIVANSLGYDHAWNSGTKTSEITTREIDQEPVKEDNNDSGTDPGKNPDENHGLEPELGGSDLLYEEGLILNQYYSLSSLYGKSTGVNEISSVNGSASLSIFTTMMKDANENRRNVERYAFYGNAPMGEITSNIVDDKIEITVKNLYSQNGVQSFAGSGSKVVNTISNTYHANQLASTFTLNLLTKNVAYDLELSSDRTVLYVNLYSNYISSLTLGTNPLADYITLTGNDALEYTFTQGDGVLHINLPYVSYPIVDQQANVIGGKHIKSFYTMDVNGALQLSFVTAGNYEIKTKEDGKNLRIYLASKDSTVIDNTTPSIDASKYHVIIPRPAIVTKEMIYDYDDYFNNKIEIKLHGDYTAFFNSNKILSSSKIIQSIDVKLNKYNETIVIITTSKLQGYEYAMDKNNIYVRIGDPRDIYQNIVVLDPGHGGGANGAEYFNTKEKDINFKILYEIGKKYFNSNPTELKVYYTRISDVDMSLADRAAFAKKVGADLFVSLHMNAFTSSSVNGTEVYYSSNNKATMSGLNSKTLATIFNNNLVKALGTTDRGAKNYGYAVVKNNTVPAVLLELGFISNPSDFKLITDPTIQDKTAKLIYDTLLDVFQKYPTGR